MDIFIFIIQSALSLMQTTIHFGQFSFSFYQVFIVSCLIGILVFILRKVIE